MAGFTRQTSFAAGLLAPIFRGRSDLPLYPNGLAKCSNMFISKHGAAVSRPGTRWIADTKSGAARLIPFIYSDDTSYVLEVGDQYIRFYSNGVQVQSGGSPLEVATPYVAADIWGIRYAQVGDVLTLTHPNYAPRELKRLGATTWTLSTVTFDRPTMTVPAATPFRLTNGDIVAADATHPDREWTWQVTQIRRDPLTGVVTETAPFTITNTTTGAAVPARVSLYYDRKIRIVTGLTAAEITALTADPNFITYRYYRGRGGLFGWIGDAKTEDFSDTGQEPDYSIPPPQGRNPFKVAIFSAIGGFVRAGTTVTVTTSTAHGLRAGDTFVLSPGEANFVAGTYTVATVTSATVFTVTGWAGAAVASTVAQTLTRTENPTAVNFFQERRVFGATYFRPGFLFASATGDYANFDEAMLPVAGQALAFELAARRREEIRHFLTHQKLLVFTNSSVWTFDGAGGPLESDSVEARIVEEIGIGTLPPLLVDGVALYQRNKAAGIRAVGFEGGGPGTFSGQDVSAHAQHLFEAYSFYSLAGGLKDWTYAEDPDGVVWGTSNSHGGLYSLTFQRNGQAAWAQHWTETEAFALGYGFQSVCAVPESYGDGVYVIVRRQASKLAAAAYCVERMASRNGLTSDYGMAIDSARSKTVGAAGLITGLTEFATGTTVYVWRSNWSSEAWGPFTVSAAKEITLTQAVLGYDPATLNGATVLVGIPYDQYIETLDALPGDMRNRQCTSIGLEVRGNGEVGLDGTIRRLLSIGPDTSHLTTYNVPSTDVVRDLTMFSSNSTSMRVPIGSGWGTAAKVAIKGTSKWWSVVSLTREFDSGT